MRLYAWRKNVSGIVASAAAVVLGSQQGCVIFDDLDQIRGDRPADSTEPMCTARVRL